MLAFATLSTFVVALSTTLHAVAGSEHGAHRRRHAGVRSVEQPELALNGTLEKRGQTFDNARFTMFYQNGVAGACGTVHSDNDWVSYETLIVLSVMTHPSADSCSELSGTLQLDLCCMRS